MSRDLLKTRAHILDVAFWEVYTKGFQGVSVNDIVAKTNVTKGAFFHHFPTKLDLGYALVDDVIKEMILDRWTRPLSAYKNPFQGVLKQMQKHIGESPDSLLKYGCPLNNLVQEMAPVDEGFNRRLKEALELWVDETAKHIKRSQDEGYIKKDLKAKEIAEYIVMAHEGFFGIIKGLGEKRVFDSLFKSLKIYGDAISIR